MTSWITRLSSVRNAAWCDLRSKYGTLVCIILFSGGLRSGRCFDGPGSPLADGRRVLPRSNRSGLRFRRRTPFVLPRECHRSALALERCRSSFQDSHHFQPIAPTGQRFGAFLNTIEKMLTFGSQRFLLFDVWDVAVPVVIRIMKVGEGVVVRRALHPHIVNANFFVGLQIVVNNHSPSAYDSHFTNLSGLQPTALNGGKSLLSKSQGDVRHILDAGRNMGVALTIDNPWKFAKDVQDDRDVVRGEVPGNVDVLLKQTQVKAPRVDIADLADISGLDNLNDLAHRS